MKMFVTHPTCIRVFRMIRSLAWNDSSRDSVVTTPSEVPLVARAIAVQSPTCSFGSNDLAKEIFFVEMGQFHG